MKLVKARPAQIFSAFKKHYMKKVLLLFAVVFSVSAFATIRTVSNNPSTIAHFNTIQAAIDAASSGDTIYVHGSPNTYTGFNIASKRLVIIGPGYRPEKNLAHTVQVNTQVTISGIGASGSELQGLIFTQPVSVTTLGVSNIRVVRNRFFSTLFYLTPNTAGTITGYLFESNWFDNSVVISSNAYTIENFLFQNNIFYESGCCISASISGFTNSVNVLIDHNLFYGRSTGTGDVFASNTRFLTISNNIFVRRNITANLSSSIFNNNITFNSANDAPWTVNSNVNGGGNIADQDPQMADQESVNNAINNPQLNFTIAAGPANNTATDGKDIGLLFDATGSLNWTNSRISRLPFIYSMSITTPTVVPGGGVSVTVESRRSN
jgi:hypothetical protein